MKKIPTLFVRDPDVTVKAVVIGCVIGLAALTAAPADAATIRMSTLADRLVVRAEAGASTYDRAKFKHWTDANGDCQNTRAEVLIKESKAPPTLTSTGCSVARGKWLSPFDGLTWTLPSDVDIDHHVALAEAWRSGASAWTASRREAYANDLYRPTLNAMTDNLNSSKGDRDPADWLPPKARCKYVIDWVLVKYRWGLTVDAAENAVIQQRLAPGTACGDKIRTVPTRP